MEKESEILKTFKLPSGRTATIRKAFGRDVRKARVMAAGQPEMFTPALASVLMTIDGEPFAMEDMDDMEMSDYLAIELETAELFPNFPTPPRSS